jgi:YHS domain-containing protein/mono/diheme cytochrome c family protein
MALLRRKIRAPDVRFVSFTVDPEYDTPPVLQQYAMTWRGDPRWELVSTNELPQVASQMKVAVQHTSDKEDPITHSTSFFLGDRTGQVRGIYDSLDDDSLKQLVQDVDAMEVAANLTVADPDRSQPSAPAETAGGAAARGGALYNSIGCAACHSQVRIAPPLDGIADRPVYLEDGGQVVADDTYLINSIFNPTLQVVSGYQALMPSYEGYISPSQGRDLIAYIRSLDGGPGQGLSAEPAAPNRKVKDPVCGMEVVASDRNPHMTYEGSSFYFCSDKCLVQFSGDPGRYARPKR